LQAFQSTQRRIAGWLGATLGVLVISLAGAGAARAESNPNAYDCSGSIAAGEKEPGSEGTAVRYAFHCSGPITGYQLESQIPLTGLQSAPLVANEKGKPLSETFSCGGEIPGYALDCVGTANAAWDQISGDFSIGTKLCAEPREDPLLTVVYAYLEKGVVTQAISGPFDLGRPQGCHGGRHGTRLTPASSSHSGKHGKKGKKGKHGKNGKNGKKK
jgi:hypothetical protein